MFTVKMDGRFFVIDRNNKYREFGDYEALIKWLCPSESLFYRNNLFTREERLGNIAQVGHNWNDSGISFIVFDSLWRVVALEKLAKDVDAFYENQKKTRNVSYYLRRILACRNRHLNIGFRSLPVPHIHRYGHCRYYRRMRTTQELRRNCYEQEFARGTRRKKYLPNYWDEVPKARRARYSWKNQKKRKQWM